MHEKLIHPYYINKILDTCAHCDTPWCRLCPLHEFLELYGLGDFDYLVLSEGCEAPFAGAFQKDDSNIMTIVDLSPSSRDISLGDKWIADRSSYTAHPTALRPLDKSKNSTVIASRPSGQGADNIIELLDRLRCQYFDDKLENAGLNKQARQNSLGARDFLIINVPPAVSLTALVDAIGKLTEPEVQIDITSDRHTP